MDATQQILATDLGPLRVARAERGDVDRVVSILDEATAWLEARGIDQWHPYAGMRAAVARRIARGETWLGWLGDQPVVTLALLWSDDAMWGARPPDAGYVHALAVRRAVAGHGVGRAALEWAASEVARAGRSYLRLDCVAHNAALRSYYEAAGFAHRGDRTYPGEDSASSLYERPVSVDQAAQPEK